MARQIFVDLSNSIEAWRQKTNLMGTYIGDLDNLTTTVDTSVVGAINFLDEKALDSSETKSLLTVTQTGPTNLASLSYNNSTGEFTFATNAITNSTLPGISASKITSDVLDPARIPNLSANKITTDVLNLARLPSLPASQITSGIIDSNHIPNLRGSKIISEVPIQHIPPIPLDGPPIELDSLGFGFPSDLYGLPNSGNPNGPVLMQRDQTVANSRPISGAKDFSGTVQFIDSDQTLMKLDSAITVGSDIFVDSNNIRNVGTATARFATMYATTFDGVATSSLFADLAEKYTTPSTLPFGTVVSVAGPEETAEVHPAKEGDIVVGVISTEPALMMNKEADGQYVGLKGRLPVRIKGPILKGQIVTADEDGVGCFKKEGNLFSMVGIALETNEDDGEKLVECYLKV